MNASLGYRRDAEDAEIAERKETRNVLLNISTLDLHGIFAPLDQYIDIKYLSNQTIKS
jgi:hypothetical protein